MALSTTIKRVAIYGGAFNPIHNGHLKVMLEAQARGDFQEVWVIPTYENAWGKKLAPFEDRFQMAKLAMEILNPKIFKLVDWEEKYQTKYTFDLVTEIRKNFPDTELTLILGPDQDEVKECWYRWEELSKLVGVLVVPDQGPTRSSRIRHLIQEGNWLWIQQEVPKPVLEYLLDYNHNSALYCES